VDSRVGMCPGAGHAHDAVPAAVQAMNSRGSTVTFVRSSPPDELKVTDEGAPGAEGVLGPA
jgi:hypothetical protein